MSNFFAHFATKSLKIQTKWNSTRQMYMKRSSRKNSNVKNVKRFFTRNKRYCNIQRISMRWKIEEVRVHYA